MFRRSVGELTPKQRAFVEHYLQTWNASEAARRAGYATRANVQGARMLANDSISARIKERLSELQMASDEVLTRLTEQARGTVEDFGDIDKYGSFHLDLAKAKARGRLGNIKKLKPAKYGCELELHDAQAALVTLGRYHKLWTDKVEHEGTVEVIEKPDLSKLSDDELAALAELLRKSTPA